MSGCRLSDIGYRISDIGCRLSAIGPDQAARLCRRTSVSSKAYAERAEAQCRYAAGERASVTSGRDAVPRVARRVGWSGLMADN
jgi:hypothetical protein